MPLIGRVKLDLAIDKLVENTNDNVRAVYMSGLGNVISETPVGLTISEVGSKSTSGTTRNNWFLTVGVPSSSTTTSKSASGAGSFRQLSQMPKDVLGKSIYFTNNKKHINILEYGGFPTSVKKGSWTKSGYQILSVNGFSGQVAPKGWVRGLIIAMQNKIRSL